MTTAPPQSAPALEISSLPTNGRWIWREESKTLEYLSNNPGADKKDGKKRGKGGFLQPDFSTKLNERATPAIGNRQYGQPAHARVHGLQRNVKTRQKQVDELDVTMDRVKDVAYDIMADNENLSPPFDDLYDTLQFDIFLIHLLKYFQTFFEKRAHENKPNPMNIEPSVAEVQLYEDLCKQLDRVKKQLGQAYCVLVLGLGLESYHHMACGLSRVSATYTDRSMYETMYSFCTFVVWIAFRRKDYEIIRTEVGNMLRSETFNPALRIKNAEGEDDKKEPVDSNGYQFESGRGRKAGKKNVNEPAQKMAPADYRRLNPKRPAIKSIIHQRSPAVVAILPSPKEESSWLFRRKGALSPSSLANISRDKLEADRKDAQLEMITTSEKAKFRAGIIGEALNQFNKLTLTPLGADNEEGEEEDGSQAGDRRESQMGKSHGDPSRQQTARSQATTEAPFTDDEEEFND